MKQNLHMVIGRRALAGLGVLIASGTGQAWGAGGLPSARLQATGRGATLSLALEGPLEWHWQAAEAPLRLMLVLQPARWRGPIELGPAGPITGGAFDAATGRLTLRLSRPALPRLVAAQAGRLIIAITPSNAEAFVTASQRAGGVLAGQVPALPLVVIDPGHGGFDPGAIGARGTQEKRITLAAAQALRRALEEGGQCRVALTRTRDAFLPLADRVAFARSHDAALLVSLHADSAPGARGASVYTLAETASDPLSEALARRENDADLAGGLALPSVPSDVQAILLSLMRQETRLDATRFARMAVRELAHATPILPNPQREAGFIVLKAPEIPSVLVEMGFLSDARDEAALRKPEHRTQIAAALARAVETWLASVQRPSSR